MRGSGTRNGTVRVLWLFVFIAGFLLGHASVAWGAVPAAPYDSELYETGYMVFLMNGNVRDALRTAEVALEVRRNDRVWRRRAAECAEMAGEPAKALLHWSHLALIMTDDEAYHRALKLAAGLNDTRAAMVLLRHRLVRERGPETIRAFVDGAVKLNEIDQAVSFLEKIRQGASREYALERLAHLHEAVGRPDMAAADLVDLSTIRPLVAGELHRLARLQYGTGDLAAAYRTLKGGVSTAAEHDPEFLADLGDICWMMQDVDCSAAAAARLVDQGKERAVDYRRIIFHLRDTDPAGALRAARKGALHFGAVPFFDDMAVAGELVGNWKELDLFVSGLSSVEREELKKRTGYWLFLSKIAGHLGRSEESLTCYRRALALDPKNAGLAAGYLWMLMDGDRYGEVKEFAGRYAEGGPQGTDLADALPAAAVYLGEYGKALRLYHGRFAAHRYDPLWLISYADVLDQNNRTDEAFVCRMQAFSLVRANLEKVGGESAKRDEMQLDLVRLMLRLQGGDLLDSRMVKIMSDASDAMKRELVVAWALSSARSDFARRWLVRAYVRDRVAPRWVQLGLALEENDRVMIAKLLEDRPGRLPYRDAIEGAQRVGAVPLAQEMAWERSRENPDDYLLQKQVRELFSAHPSNAGYRLRTMDLAGVSGIGNRAFLALPISNRYSLSAEVDHTRYSTLKNGVVNNPDSGDISILMGMKRLFEKGEGDIHAGWRSALEDFPVFDASFSYRPTPHIGIEGEIGYSVPAEESIPLRIGGMKDLASLRLVYSPTGRETVQAGISRAWFRDQARRLLGYGNTYSLDVSHAMSFEYPDLRVRGFAGYYDFTAKGAPQGAALSLVPAGFAAEGSFFIPESFFQVGMGVGLGQGYRSGYTGNWKPFGSADMSWRTSYGFGFDLGAGARGPLFGCDSLHLELLLSKGTSGTSDFSGVLDVGYTYFFN